MQLKFLANRVVFLLILACVVGVAMGIVTPAFFSIDNLLGMTQFGAVLALVAFGQSLVVLGGGGGIDLSIGSTLSLTGVIFGLLVAKAGWSVWTASAVALLFAVGLGAITGFLVARVGMPPFVGSLGTMYTFAAIALVITNGFPISGFPASFGFLGQQTLLGVPAQVLLIVVPVFLLLHFIMTRTIYGRQVYLVGVNDNAARLTGTNVARVRMCLYMASALLAGIGAIVMASWLMAARPDAGSGMEMQALTVAVLGGIDIMGGEGTLLGTLLAVLIITMISYGLQLANVNSIWQMALLGGILLLAVVMNQFIARRAKTGRG